MKSRILLLLALDLGLLIGGLANLPSVLQRPTVPFTVAETDGRLIVSSLAYPTCVGELQTGDIIHQFDGHSLRSPELMELAADCSTVGDEIRVTGERIGGEFITKIILVPYYDSVRFVLVVSFVGIVVWCFGVLVLVKRQDSAQAAVLHGALIALASTILYTQGSIDPADPLSLAWRMMFFLVYPLTAAAFMHFVLLFPRRSSHANKWFLIALYGAITGTGMTSAGCFLDAARTLSPEAMNRFSLSYDVLHVLLLLYGLSVPGMLIRSYAVARSPEQRKQIQWILWGIAVGVIPFLMLIIFPQVVLSRDLIPEDLALLFFLVPIFALTVSFIKYRLLDIDLLVNRSIVYGILTFMIGFAYILVVSVFAGFVSAPGVVPVILLSLMVAVIANPIRVVLQQRVDTLLFPARAKFRHLLPAKLAGLRRSTDADGLLKCACHEVIRDIPLRSVGIYLFTQSGPKRVVSAGESMPDELTLTGELQDKLRQEAGIIDYSEKTSVPAMDLRAVGGGEATLSGVMAPIRDAEGKPTGLIIVRTLQQNRHLEPEEQELILSIAAETSELLERFRLQEAIILEREERKRIEEVNELKSRFVSIVSHELRTPLTSIRMFSEMLQTKSPLSPDKRKKFASIIEGESVRLSGLISNLLDFARIERGTRTFRSDPVNMHDVIQRSVHAMEYELRSHRVDFVWTCSSRLPPVIGDPDALEESLINLLSNAVNYSGPKKKVRLAARESNNSVVVEIHDNGKGIPGPLLHKVFESYYRSSDATAMTVKGIGLGLAIVRHTVQSHGGSVEVASTVGKGTTFRVILPARQGGNQR